MGDRVVKYEASAGSGKTFQLTLAFLARLFRIFTQFRRQPSGQQDWKKVLSSVLAITFTNKAAGEMKERILNRLKRFALNQRGYALSDGDQAFLCELEVESGIPAETILELSSLILETILSNYNDFNVKTIDSLMSAIVKVISPDLELPPDFEIQVDAVADLHQKAYLYIEELCDRNWPAMEELLNDISSIEPLTNWQVEEEIMSLLVFIHRLSMNQEIREVNEESLVRLKNITATEANNFKKHLRELVTLIKAEPAGQYINIYLKGNVINLFLMKALASYASSDRLVGDLNAVVNKAFFKKRDPSSFFKKDCPLEYRDRFINVFESTRKSLSRFVRLFSEFRVMNLNRFYRGFTEFRQQDRQKIFVEEFSRTLRSRLQDWQQSALPYIYLKLSDRFHHFLFDEFQDTSELQFKALAPLIDETLSADEQTSLFIVGDRKQAIYRWRGGNSELMNEEVLRTEIPAIDFISPDPFTQSLTANWRSAGKIVDFNNRFWDVELLSTSLTAGGIHTMISQDFDSSFQYLPTGRSIQTGYVKIEVKECSDSFNSEADGVESELLRLILGMVREAEQKGYRGAEIAVLVRKNSEGRDIIRFLSGQGIAAISDESLLLSSSPTINQLIAFFKFLDFPQDNLSFFTFITGEIFSRVAHQLFPEEFLGFDETVFICEAREMPFYKVFQECCPQLWQALIEPFFKSVGFLAVYDLYEDILQIYSLYENFPEAAMFLLSLGELLHQLEQRQISSITAFIHEWEAIREMERESQFAIDMPEANDSIRVMTLHKAKGLEFPVVILPLKDSHPPHEKPIFLEEGHIFQISKDYATLNQQLKDLYLEEVRKAVVDILNLYYVGFTRSRAALLIPLVIKKLSDDTLTKKNDDLKRLKNFAQVLLNHPLLEWHREGESGEKKSPVFDGTYIREFGIFDEAIPTEPVPVEGKKLVLFSKRVLTSHWQREFLVFSGSPIPESREREARLRGDQFHQVLAKVEIFNEKEDVRPIITTIIEGFGFNPEYIELINAFLTHEHIFPFFRGDFAVYNEVEVARVGDISGDYEYRRIDRLMVGKDEVIVIDYKTGREKSKVHERQIRQYLEIVRPLLRKEKYRAFLLYPDLLEVEEVQ